MTAIFLGAGFSKWAANLPLVSELFDFDIAATNDIEQGKLNRLAGDWVKWKQESSNTNPEQFIYWCINKSSHRKSRIIWYIGRRLSDPFMTRISGSYSPLMFDEKRAKNHPGVIRTKEFLSNLLNINFTGILTCNYDTLIECALGTDGFNYGTIDEQLYGRGHNPQFPWQFAHVNVNGSTTLAKLHGSLSWDSTTKFTSGKPGRAGKALIVPPTPEKIPPKGLVEVWKLGSKILKESTRLVVFGFAFNPYDVALLNFLKKNGKHLSQIILIDPDPNLSIAKILWPKSKLECLNPLENFDTQLNEWLHA